MYVRRPGDSDAEIALLHLRRNSLQLLGMQLFYYIIQYMDPTSIIASM